MPISTAGKRRNNQSGFSYVMVLAAVVVMGIMVEVGTTLSSQARRAEQEAELLYRGMAYRNAIRSYYRANGKYPPNLEELVRDSRHPQKRHLRMVYSDPFSKEPYSRENPGWTLVRDATGGIRGVASQSGQEPRKKANFPTGLERFENAMSYSKWIFEYTPEPVQPGVTIPIATPVGPPVRRAD